MSVTEAAYQEYARLNSTRCIEVGGTTPRTGWFTTNVYRPCPEIFELDATAPFPFPDDTADFIYSEHMIEHVDYAAGARMLKECHRVLRPGGAIRIVTPSIGFLVRLAGADLSKLEREYLAWHFSVTEYATSSPGYSHFFNTFVRAWGHTFIYDRATLAQSILAAGFSNLSEQPISESDRPQFRSLENVSRLPPGYLDMESMILEAEKPVA